MVQNLQIKNGQKYLIIPILMQTMVNIYIHLILMMNCNYWSPSKLSITKKLLFEIGFIRSGVSSNQHYGTEFTNKECSKVFDAKHGEYLYSFNIDDELQKKLFL